MTTARTILVTGATGFIGAALVERLIARGDRVIRADDPSMLPRATRIDAVVNLAGAPLFGLPWFGLRRREIWRSRVGVTENLVRWMATLENKPRVLVNGSAVGFYGDQGDETLIESGPAGRGFAAELCAAWEASAMKATTMGVRVVCLRIGLVMHNSGGPLATMALPVRLGFGAVFGSGRQWMSWIARDDLLRMIVSAIDDERWHGPVNAVAPEPMRHAGFQQALARTLARPMALRTPSWLLKAMLGEMSSIFLFSQHALPAKALALGFAFDVCWAADMLALQLGPPPAALPLRSRGCVRPRRRRTLSPSHSFPPETNMTITLIGAALSPFVRKVRVVLAEKGLAYKHDPVSPFAPPPGFEDISPSKRIPVLRDDSEGPDATLPDSSAICGYLERKHPSPALYPAQAFAYGRALWLEEYADHDLVAALGAGIFRAIVINKLMRKEPDHALANDTWEQKVPRFLGYFETELGSRKHFVADTLTIADIAIASPFVNAAHAGFAPDPARYPNLARFLKAMHARPSFAACIEEELKLLAPLGLKYAG